MRRRILTIAIAALVIGSTSPAPAHNPDTNRPSQDIDSTVADASTSATNDPGGVASRAIQRQIASGVYQADLATTFVHVERSSTDAVPADELITKLWIVGNPMHTVTAGGYTFKFQMIEGDATLLDTSCEAPSGYCTIRFLASTTPGINRIKALAYLPGVDARPVGGGEITIREVFAVRLSPPILTGDGRSSGVATAFVGIDGQPVPGESASTVRFFQDNHPRDLTMGPTVDNGDGTFSATFTVPKGTGMREINVRTARNGTSFALLRLVSGRTGTFSLGVEPSVLQADGVSKATATVTVRDEENQPVEDETVSFSVANGLASAGPTRYLGQGVYTTTLTASTRTGLETVTARGANSGQFASAFLQLAPGRAATVSVGLAPANIAPDGTSRSTATATVVDANANPVPTESVTFTSDGDVAISATRNNGDGTYTATLTASTTPGTERIVATALRTQRSGSTTLTESWRTGQASSSEDDATSASRTTTTQPATTTTTTTTTITTTTTTTTTTIKPPQPTPAWARPCSLTRQTC